MIIPLYLVYIRYLINVFCMLQLTMHYIVPIGTHNKRFNHFLFSLGLNKKYIYTSLNKL